MKRGFGIPSATCLVLTLLWCSSAWAYFQPLGLNLGYTSFLDGAPPAGPGWYLAEYLSYYTAGKLQDSDAPDPRINVWVNLNQVLYQSNTPILFGGKWGLDVIVPFVSIESHPLPGDNGGLGDITIGPYLQWDPIMGKNGPIFMHRVEFQTIWPTGRYHREKLLNPGGNHFSLDPYWAGTYFFTPQWTASWRLHYLWNADNDDPFVGLENGEGEPARKVEPGMAFHANFATSYELLPKRLRVGVNGYYLTEITKSKVDGADQGMEQVLGIGPGLLYSFSQNTHVFFNAYFETLVHNRPQGELFVLRLVHHF
jgi:anthranilate 1,2-dioxygenase (deaminating, decarboxylating) large subunit